MNIVQGKAGNAGSAGGGSGASSVAATGGTWFAVRGRLREYQRSAVETTTRLVLGRTNTLLVAPTGSGKTHMFAAVVQAATAEGYRTLVVAHRRELLDQAHEKLERVGVESSIYRGGDGAFSPCDVVLASIQCGEPEGFTPDLIVVDEAHHAPAESYRGHMSGTLREHARGMTTPTRTITIVEALRDRAGWTQRQLAELAGLLPSVIEQHELRGVALTDHALLRLSQVFVVPVEALQGTAPIPGARPRLIDDNDPIVMKLLRAVDPDRHTVSDFDAARAAYNATVGARLQSGRAVDERLALAFLEAACLLRVEGAHVHTSAVLARAAAALFEARQ